MRSHIQLPPDPEYCLPKDQSCAGMKDRSHAVGQWQGGEGGEARHLSGLGGRAWGSYTGEKPHRGSKQHKGGHPHCFESPLEASSGS